MLTCDYVLAFGMVILLGIRPVVDGRATYCGKELADALELLCDSTYYTPTGERNERSLQGVHRRPLLSVLLQRRKRNVWNPNGVVDECCRNTCSLDELRAYCG